MLNTDDFVKRLEQVFEYYGLSGASFADKIGIQRSSLSHLLSGRNKPSLEFVMKIVSVLPEVNFEWILNGKGNFPKSSVVEKPVQDVQQHVAPTLSFPDDISEKEILLPKYDSVEVSEKVIQNESLNYNTSSEKGITISQIVIFYNDGTFSNYKPN